VDIWTYGAIPAMLAAVSMTTLAPGLGGGTLMKDMGYADTFILVATDCPAERGVIPPARGDRKPLHLLQYELLSAHPYRYMHADLLYEVHVRHKSIPDDVQRAREAEIRGELLGRPHPCLRACMLPKRYGWGIHFDPRGRIAIYPRESDEYRRFARADGVTHLVTVLRSRRD
jgi:hypothetical protein